MYAHVYKEPKVLYILLALEKGTCEKDCAGLLGRAMKTMLRSNFKTFDPNK